MANGKASYIKNKSIPVEVPPVYNEDVKILSSIDFPAINGEDEFSHQLVEIPEIFLFPQMMHHQISQHAIEIIHLFHIHTKKLTFHHSDGPLLLVAFDMDYLAP